MSEISLHDSIITIIGAGLMGGSMALALKGKCKEINGIELQTNTIHLANQMQIFDHIAASPKDLLSDTNLIILATPVYTILDLIKHLPDWTADPVTVMDLGSTKVEICHEFEKLPDRFQAIGGHPLCGKEKLGLVHADSGLYQNARFALVSLPHTSQTTKVLIEELVQKIGALPIWIEAEKHDRWIAATSHLPYFLAVLLTSVTPLEASNLIGPGFLSASRLAATPTSMMFDVIKSNRQLIVHMLNSLDEKMSFVKKLLDEADDDDLEMFLQAAIARHRTLIGLEDEKT
jgi:prephenate dehydrogenase